MEPSKQPTSVGLPYGLTWEGIELKAAAREDA